MDRPRQPVRTLEFERWWKSLDADRRAEVNSAIRRVAAGGPTLGRPRVDVIHGSRIHKLKEARLGRGIRLLFAFDSKQNPVMLLGGDKTGQWNRWYRSNIPRAERLYAEHERSNGKEIRWPGQRGTGRTSPPISR
jgi:hypothetical protein